MQHVQKLSQPRLIHTIRSFFPPRKRKRRSAKLKERGVKFVKGWVNSVADLQYVPAQGGGENGGAKVKTDVIVDASGLGERSIIGIADPLVHPIRGQTVSKVDWCLLGLSFYVNHETSETTYMIPRSNGDVFVGGTFQVGNWDVRSRNRKRDFRTLLDLLLPRTRHPPTPSLQLDHLTPDISTIKVLRHNVGLCPGRTGGARVEKEVVALPSPRSADPWLGSDLATVPNALRALQSTPDVENRDAREEKTFKVVHAYGVRPAGYQESWGVAEDVCKLVGEFLAE
ncbi:hypothetical protein FS837_006268 [Tulasnella sp. UAMH 9824]|nr:hypothetical protein FS837_006268 [Tulasnella sp. UAMH 9824]